MKKYHVLRKIGEFSPSAIRSFDNVEQAKGYVELMRVSEENEFTEFYICELIP